MKKMKSSNIKTTLRMERKYLIEPDYALFLETLIFSHPLSFRKAFPQRLVNTLYFDTASFSNLKDGLEGTCTKLKPRLRWYSQPQSRIHSVQFELKLKMGNLGKKSVQKFKLSKDKLLTLKVEAEQIVNLLDSSFSAARLSLEGTEPVLLVRYLRDYYVSADDKLRLTLDSEICYTGLFLSDVVETDEARVVLELKYKPEDEENANSAVGEFPFTLTRHSKYSIGMGKFIY